MTANWGVFHFNTEVSFLYRRICPTDTSGQEENESVFFK